MKNLLFILMLTLAVAANAKDYKVFFKSEATDNRTNIVEPDLLFLNIDDKVIFSSTNVNLDKIVIMKIDQQGIMTEVNVNTYRELVDHSYLQTKENCVYLYHSAQYLSSGAFGLSVVGSYYQKQEDTLKTVNHNQNFKDRMDHILNKITPVDKVYPPEPPPPPPVEE